MHEQSAKGRIKADGKFTHASVNSEKTGVAPECSICLAFHYKCYSSVDMGEPTTTHSEEVFISYSWDNEHHIGAVLEFSNRLRSEGIDCVLDQYEESPAEGWPRWMDRKIRDATFVLMVCTEQYYDKVMNEAGDNAGRGVKWEGGLIYQHIYNAGSNNSKFIPVIFKADDQQFIPTPLQGVTRYDLSSVSGYDKLYARLIGRPLTEKPTLGSRRPQPKREVKTDFSMFVSSPIDPTLWDEAKWRGAFYLMGEDLPPVFGLAFQNEVAAKKIFQQWHERYGERDLFEELRISIIEGDIKGEEPGYSIHIGIDLENTIKRYREAGLSIDPNNDGFLTLTRIHRMNPSPESRNLDMFKEAYRHYKTYTLIPAILNREGTDIAPLMDLGIYKSSIHFRNVKDINQADEDYVVLNSGAVKRSQTGVGGSRFWKGDNVPHSWKRR
jgi:hypothetical protein